MSLSNPHFLCRQCAAAIPLAAAPRWLDADLSCAACGWAPARHEGYPVLDPALAEAGSDYDPAGFARLAAAERWHFWFAPRARLLARLVARHFPAATSFLEVGCGTGYVTAAIAAERGWDRLMGAEVSALGLSEAQRLLPPTVELMQLDARDMPFRSAFDVIGCFDVLEHIEDDATVLRGFAAALRPGGGVVLSVPQHMWLWSGADVHAQHKRRYARGELEAGCRAAGLEVVASLSYATLTLPLMLASRLLSGRVSDAQGAAEELHPPAWLNALLRGLLRAEVGLSLAGLHLPVGGSRVVVARRPAVRAC